MVIEWQRFHVRPDVRDLFLSKDEEIWTAGLRGETGFLGKEVWLGEEDEDLILVIRWRSEEEWKGILQERLEDLEKRFRRAVPEEGYEMVESLVFHPLDGNG